jgi:hypothetical protein
MLNLLLIPFLVALGLLDGEGAAAGDGKAGDGAAEGAKPDDAAKPDDKAAAKPDTKPDEGELGDAGKAALTAERKARRDAEARATAAEKERDALKTATQSESEKAISDAKKEAATEADAKWAGLIRRTKVEAAIAALGGDPVLADSREFADLKVTDTGDVEELTATVDAFKAAHPTLFTARVPGGSADQGAKPPGGQKPATLQEAVEAHYASGQPA